MMRVLAHAAYDVLGAAAAALAVPALPWMWYRGWTEGLTERLGAVPLPAAGTACRPLWLHAASVGETLAALPVYEALRRAHPELPWVVSNTTLTGRAVTRRVLRPEVSTLLPIDALGIVDRAVARLRPRLLVVVENEIWPGLLRAAERCGARIVFVNARLSERALRGYSLARPLFAAALARVDAFCAQSRDDAARLRALGVADDRLHVTGQLKAGRTVTGEAPVAIGNRTVLVAASTQPGEEHFVLDACSHLWPDYPNLVLVLAPRRPERFEEVAALLQERGVSHCRRSAGDATLPPAARVLLLDTVGELAAFYGTARGAFVGGSVAAIGGHNVLEPAVAGIPVSFGIHTDNVRSSAEALLEAAAAVRVGDSGALAAHWRQLLADPDAARRTGERARAVAAQLAGAVPATVAIIEALLREEP